jgi:cation transport ATPase
MITELRTAITELRTAQDPTRFALELIRTVMLLLCLVGWVMYPLELLLLEHWTEAWQSHIPFFVAVPGFFFTLWVLFDRKTPWARWAFIVTMWASVLTGVLGAYFHLVWNFEGEISWEFEAAMEAMAGSRPVLAAMAFTHMGVTGLLSIFRAR